MIGFRNGGKEGRMEGGREGWLDSLAVGKGGEEKKEREKEGG